MADLEKGPTVPNTEKSTAWALRTICDWCESSNVFQKVPQTSTFNGVHVSADKGTSTSRPKRAMEKTLHTYFNTMCMKADIQERKTNHSLRATSATAMFAAQVDDQRSVWTQIFKSFSSVRASYSCSKASLSKVLAGGSGSGSTSFAEELQVVKHAQTKQTAVQRSEQYLHAKSAFPAGLFSSLFNGLSNCTIKFAPKNINIGVSLGEFESSEVDEFDTIVSQLQTIKNVHTSLSYLAYTDYFPASVLNLFFISYFLLLPMCVILQSVTC